MHILCSGPPGSIPDLIARAVADQLFITHGLRAVVDNRPGAAGQISVGALKGAAGDGLTLLLTQGAIATVYPFLYAKLAYDPAIDLQPVSLASEMLLGLAVGPAVPKEGLSSFWCRLILQGLPPNTSDAWPGDHSREGRRRGSRHCALERGGVIGETRCGGLAELQTMG